MTLPKFMRRSIPRSQRGQSLVEFALTLPILIMVLGGVLDLGRVYFVYTALTDTAGEGALFLSINPKCYVTNPDDPYNAIPPGACDNPSNLEYRMRNSAGQGNSLIDFSNLTVTVCYVDGVTSALACKTGIPGTPISGNWTAWKTSIPPAGSSVNFDPSTQINPMLGDSVFIRLRYDFTLLTPVISQIIGNTTLPLTIQASHPIVSK